MEPSDKSSVSEFAEKLVKPVLRPEDMPPEVPAPFPPHEPYAPPELLGKKRNEEKAESDEGEESDEEEDEKTEKKDEESEKKIESSFDKKIRWAIEKVQEKIKNQRLKIYDLEEEMKQENEELELNRKKLNIFFYHQEAQRYRKKLVEAEKKYSELPEIAENSEEDEEDISARFRRDKERLDQREIIEKISWIIKDRKKKIEKLRKEIQEDEIKAGRRQAEYAIWRDTMHAEIEAEENDNYVGEPKWSWIYF